MRMHQSPLALELLGGIISARAERMALALELCLGRVEPGGKIIAGGADEIGDVALKTDRGGGLVRLELRLADWERNVLALAFAGFLSGPSHFSLPWHGGIFFEAMA